MCIPEKLYWRVTVLNRILINEIPGFLRLCGITPESLSNLQIAIF